MKVKWKTFVRKGQIGQTIMIPIELRKKLKGDLFEITIKKLM